MAAVQTWRAVDVKISKKNKRKKRVETCCRRRLEYVYESLEAARLKYKWGQIVRLAKTYLRPDHHPLHRLSSLVEQLGVD